MVGSPLPADRAPAMYLVFATLGVVRSYYVGGGVTLPSSWSVIAIKAKLCARQESAGVIEALWSSGVRAGRFKVK